MAVTAEEVRVFVGAEAGEHTALIADCLAEASAMVTKYLSNGYYDYSVTPAVYVASQVAVDAGLRDRAVLEVAADLFHRRNAPNGITNQFDIADGQPLRISRDPMAPAYKILRITPW